MHHWYDEELKVGDKLVFTEEVEMHLEDIGVQHQLEYGDELVVVARDDSRRFSICVADSRDTSTWQAWIFLTIAERAQEDWLISQGVAPTRKTLEDYAEEFSQLSPEERSREWEELRQASLDEFLLTYMHHNPKHRLN